MSPGFLDTWQMCLLKKGDPRTCRIKAIEEGADLRKQFPLEFFSHPGLAMIRGDDIDKEGSYMLIGESTSDKVMQFTVEKDVSIHHCEEGESKPSPDSEVETFLKKIDYFNKSWVFLLYNSKD